MFLESTILVDELTAKTFYNFKISKLFYYMNAPWMMHLCSWPKLPTGFKNLLKLSIIAISLW